MAKRTASARKQARAAGRRETRNRSVRSAVKTRVAKVRRAVTEGADNAVELGAAAVSGLDRAVAKGVLHPNNAARRKSRLMRALNAVAKGEKKAEAPAKGTGKAASGKARAAGSAKKAATRKAPARKPPAKK
jgi:small subunit ribosomal protein S20